MKRILCIGLLVSLSGCGEKAAIKDVIAQNLKDPASAEFGELTVVNGASGKFACATVNARNSMGGYTGDQQVMLRHQNPDGWVLMGEGAEQSHQSCVDSITAMGTGGGSDNALAEADAAAAAAEQP